MPIPRSARLGAPRILHHVMGRGIDAEITSAMSKKGTRWNDGHNWLTDVDDLIGKL